MTRKSKDPDQEASSEEGYFWFWILISAVLIGVFAIWYWGAYFPDGLYLPDTPKLDARGNVSVRLALGAGLRWRCGRDIPSVEGARISAAGTQSDERGNANIC